jgi:uncharacterized protein YebE (UPF0316 family)
MGRALTGRPSVRPLFTVNDHAIRRWTTPLYIPALIFLARIIDVSLGTMRMILTINGHRWWAGLLGFVEVAIWALALAGMVIYLDNPLAIVGYAGGFAVGTVVGLFIEERVAVGYRTLQIINANPEIQVAPRLREGGFRATSLPGFGQYGPVEVVLLVIRRRSLGQVLRIVEDVAPRAFVSVERADRPSGEAFGTLLGARRSRLRALVGK